MNIIVVKNPGNNDLFSIWSSQIDQFVAVNLSPRQVAEWFAIAGREYAADVVKQLRENENPFGDFFLTYEDCVAIQREFNPDAEIPPVVATELKKAS